MNQLRVVTQNRHRLVLDRSKLGSLLEAMGITVFTGFWYYGILQNYLGDHSILQAIKMTVHENKMMVIFLGAGLVLMYRIYLSLYKAIYGETIEFIKAQGAVMRNGKPFFRFAEAETVQIREITDSDNDTSFRLSIVLKNGSKKFLESSSDRLNIHSLADDIADMLNVKIVTKI